MGANFFRLKNFNVKNLEHKFEDRVKSYTSQSIFSDTIRLVIGDGVYHQGGGPSRLHPDQAREQLICTHSRHFCSFAQVSEARRLIHNNSGCFRCLCKISGLWNFNPTRSFALNKLILKHITPLSMGVKQTFR